MLSLKLVILGCIVLSASSVTYGNTITKEVLEAEMEAVAAFKELGKVVGVIGSTLASNSKAEEQCEESGVCSPDRPEHCCSRQCIPHPRLKIFVCAKCSATGSICSPSNPQQCCSGQCNPHPILRIFVCA